MRILVAVATAQALDLMTFYAAAAVAPIGLEANGFVRLAWTAGGPFGVLVWKVGLLVVLLAITDRLSHSPFAWIRVGAPSMAIAVGLAGAVANMAVLSVAVLAR